MGLICMNFLEHSVLVFRRFLSGDLKSVDSLFYRLSFNRHLEHVHKSFDLIVFLGTSILVFRRFLSGDLMSVNSLFYRLWLNRYLEHVYKGFDLFEFLGI